MSINVFGYFDDNGAWVDYDYDGLTPDDYFDQDGPQHKQITMRRLANSARRRRSKKIRRVVSRFSNTKSLQFDGVNDVAAWASGTTLTSLIGAGDFTISFWAKRSDWVVSNAAHLALLTSAITTSYYSVVALGTTAGTAATDPDLRGGIRMNVIGNGNTYLDDVTPSLDTISGVSDNTWIHVAYVITCVDGWQKPEAVSSTSTVPQ